MSFVFIRKQVHWSAIMVITINFCRINPLFSIIVWFSASLREAIAKQRGYNIHMKIHMNKRQEGQLKQYYRDCFLYTIQSRRDTTKMVTLSQSWTVSVSARPHHREMARHWLTSRSTGACIHPFLELKQDRADHTSKSSRRTRWRQGSCTSQRLTIHRLTSSDSITACGFPFGTVPECLRIHRRSTRSWWWESRGDRWRRDRRGPYCFELLPILYCRVRDDQAVVQRAQQELPFVSTSAQNSHDQWTVNEAAANENVEEREQEGHYNAIQY